MTRRRARELVIQEVLRRQEIARTASEKDKLYQEGIAVGALAVLRMLDLKHWGSWWKT